jgi:hypothetical protein
MKVINESVCENWPVCEDWFAHCLCLQVRFTVKDPLFHLRLKYTILEDAGEPYNLALALKLILLLILHSSLSKLGISAKIIYLLYQL